MSEYIYEARKRIRQIRMTDVEITVLKDGKPVDSIIGYGNVGYPELKAFVEKNRG